MDRLTNPLLFIALSSWAAAQLLKVIVNGVMTKKLDWSRLFGDGGMPSGHSATVSSLAAASALIYGTASFEFALSTIFAIVVCHDAMGVRHETGKQAMLLNEIIEILDSDDLPEIKLKELVGHTPLQVIAGILIGIANACLMYFFVF